MAMLPVGDFVFCQCCWSTYTTSSAYIQFLFFQVLAGYPHYGNGRGSHVLKLLQAMSLNLHPSIVEMWDTVIPKLIQYFDGNFQLKSICHRQL